MNNFRRTVIGRHALIIAARGESELASQIFNYDFIREVRLDLEILEVKVLMTYDDAFFRVFSIKPKDEKKESLKEAQDMVIKFYNDLINASMKLTKEELENIRKQQEKLIEESKLKAKEVENKKK